MESVLCAPRCSFSFSCPQLSLVRVETIGNRLTRLTTEIALKDLLGPGRRRGRQTRWITLSSHSAPSSDQSPPRKLRELWLPAFTNAQCNVKLSNAMFSLYLSTRSQLSQCSLSNNAPHDSRSCKASQVLTEPQGFDCRQHRCLGDRAHSCQSRIAQCIGEVRRWPLVAQEGQAQGCGQWRDGTTHSITASKHNKMWRNSACQRMYRSMWLYEKCTMMHIYIYYTQNVALYANMGKNNHLEIGNSMCCDFPSNAVSQLRWAAHSTNTNICVLFGHGWNNDVRTHTFVALVIKNHVPQKTKGICLKASCGKVHHQITVCMNRCEYIYTHIVYTYIICIDNCYIYIYTYITCIYIYIYLYMIIYVYMYLYMYNIYTHFPLHG